jgi:MerR family transcriptional regulator, heat shock protein HspR
MTSEPDKKPCKIRDVAKRLDVSVETIRAYERDGILLTERTESGQRIFYDMDVHWLECIRRLISEQGLNIAGIRRLLALMPCWEWRPCSEEDRKACPAYGDAMQPCWTMKDKIPARCRDSNCRECTVYHNAIRCENLKPRIFKITQPDQ